MISTYALLSLSLRLFCLLFLLFSSLLQSFCFPPLYSSELTRMQLDDKLTDDEFLANFETCNLHKWDHRTHIRMAWAYIVKFGRKAGSDKIFQGVENFIKNSTISRKTTFHITMTLFWIQVPSALHSSSIQLLVLCLTSSFVSSSLGSLPPRLCSYPHVDIQMVDIGILSSPPGISFDEFMTLNPQLMEGGLFLQYYKKETMLNNPAARKEFVLPGILLYDLLFPS